jgi:hypothetical protein
MPMSNGTATIHLPTARVIAACRAYLAERNERIEAMREESIQRSMQQTRWFGFGRRYTREEAITSLNRYGGLAQFSEYGSRTARAVREVLALSEVAGDTICVDSELFGVIQAYYER